MVKALVRYFGSIRLTLALLIGIAAVLCAGLLVPQKRVMSPEAFRAWEQASPALVSILQFLGLTDIYRAPVTAVIWTLFFLNLAFVLWQRVVPSVQRKIAVRPELFSEAELPAYPCRASIALSPDRTDAVLTGLKTAGYRIYGDATRFYAIRNRYSPLATLLFHASFFIILTGALISMYTRFSGTVDISEGETFTGDPAQYGPYPPPRMPIIGGHPRVSFTLLRAFPEMQDGVPTSLAVDLTEEGGRTVRRARINKPYVNGAASFVIKDLGVTPLVLLFDAITGAEIDGGFFKLDVLQGKRDGFALRELEVSVLFYPDHVVRNGNDDTASPEIRNPAFNLTVLQDGKVISRATLRPGENMRAGQYMIGLPSMRYWIRFLVVKEYGVPLVYAGFGIATAALVWRVLFFRREIAGRAAVNGAERTMNLWGRAEFYKASFEDEFQELIERIASKGGTI